MKRFLYILFLFIGACTNKDKFLGTAADIYALKNYDSLSVDEGQLIQFNLGAVSNSNVFYCAREIPEGMNVSKNGKVTWTPDYDTVSKQEVEKYIPISIYSSDREDCSNSVETANLQILARNTNRAPELADFQDQTIKEGLQLSIPIVVSDPDDDDINFRIIGNLPNLSIDQTSRLIKFQPDYTQAGLKEVIIEAYDNGIPKFASTQKKLSFNIQESNRKPVLQYLANQSTNENVQLTFNLVGSDPDGDSFKYYIEGNVPTGLTLNDTTGEVKWTPTSDQSGIYQVHFYIKDTGVPAEESDRLNLTISVGNVDRPPSLALIGDKIIFEGDLLTINLSGDDPDGQALTYSAQNVLSNLGMQFNAATKTFTWTPGYDIASLSQSSKVYPVIFTVSDGELSSSQTVNITVKNKNRIPSLPSISNITMNEGETKTVNLSIANQDPDGDILTFSGSNNPSFVQIASSNGLVTISPSFSVLSRTEVSKSFTITAKVSDGDPATNVQKQFQVTVNQKNQKPQFVNLYEGKIINLSESNTAWSMDIITQDDDGDDVSISAQNLPNGMNVGSDGKISWTTGFSSSGNYNVKFIATDNGSPVVESNSVNVTFSVGDVNQPPHFDPISTLTFNEGTAGIFTIPAATDVDGDVITYSLSPTGTPAGMTFNSQSRVLSWTPPYSFVDNNNVSKSITIRILASDSNNPPTPVDIQVDVINVNQNPQNLVLKNCTVNPRGLSTGYSCAFSSANTSLADDPDGDTVTYKLVATSNNLCPNINLVTTNKTITYDAPPKYKASLNNECYIRVQADDGHGGTSAVASIAIYGANNPPTWKASTLYDRFISEGFVLSDSPTATDIDSDPIAYSCSDCGNVPNVDTSDLSNNHNIIFNPSFQQANKSGSTSYTYKVTVVASDGESTTSTVRNFNVSDFPEWLGWLGQTTDNSPATSFAAWIPGKTSASDCSDNGLNQPGRMERDYLGNMYVLDVNNFRVVKFNSNGQVVGWIGMGHSAGFVKGGACPTSGSNNGEFFSLTGIALYENPNNHANDQLYILDWSSTSGSKVQVYDLNGNFVSRMTFKNGATQTNLLSPGKLDMQLNSPRDIAVDDQKNIYISDNGNHRIMKFDVSGNYKGWVGLKDFNQTNLTWQSGSFSLTGNKDGEFYYPRALDIDSSKNLFVIEDGNKRIQKLGIGSSPVVPYGSIISGDKTGFKLNAGSGIGNLNAAGIYTPMDLAISPSNGKMYTVDFESQLINIYNSDGTFYKSFGGYQNPFWRPQALAIDNAGNLYIGDFRGIFKFDAEGNQLGYIGYDKNNIYRDTWLVDRTSTSTLPASGAAGSVGLAIYEDSNPSNSRLFASIGDNVKIYNLSTGVYISSFAVKGANKLKIDASKNIVISYDSNKIAHYVPNGTDIFKLNTIISSSYGIWDNQTNGSSGIAMEKDASGNAIAVYAAHDNDTILYGSRVAKYIKSGTSFVFSGWIGKRASQQPTNGWFIGATSAPGPGTDMIGPNSSSIEVGYLYYPNGLKFRKDINGNILKNANGEAYLYVAEGDAKVSIYNANTGAYVKRFSSGSSGVNIAFDETLKHIYLTTSNFNIVIRKVDSSDPLLFTNALYTFGFGTSSKNQDGYFGYARGLSFDLTDSRNPLMYMVDQSYNRLYKFTLKDFLISPRP